MTATTRAALAYVANPSPTTARKLAEASGLRPRFVPPTGRPGTVVAVTEELIYVEHADGDQFAYAR